MNKIVHKKKPYRGQDEMARARKIHSIYVSILAQFTTKNNGLFFHVRGCDYKQLRSVQGLLGQALVDVLHAIEEADKPESKAW